MTDRNSKELPASQQKRSEQTVSQPIESHVLFAQGREVLISHDDNLYRLRLTSNNKLILTK